MSSLLCVAVFVLASIAIPLVTMRPYLRDASRFWPGYSRIERSIVSVGDGAFRDAPAAVETLREIPPGIPAAVKITSFLALYCGQIFPILVLYAGLGLLTSFVYFVELGFLTGLNILVAIIGTGMWAMAARGGWKASTAVLSGDHTLAESTLQKSLNWHLATLGTMGAALALAMIRGADLELLALAAPFFALAAMAFFQQAAFRAHKFKLPDAEGKAPRSEHGFELSGVRVVEVADSEGGSPDEHETAASDARNQRER